MNTLKSKSTILRSEFPTSTLDKWSGVLVNIRSNRALPRVGLATSCEKPKQLTIHTNIIYYILCVDISVIKP